MSGLNHLEVFMQTGSEDPLRSLIQVLTQVTAADQKADCAEVKIIKNKLRGNKRTNEPQGKMQGKVKAGEGPEATEDRNGKTTQLKRAQSSKNK